MKQSIIQTSIFVCILAFNSCIKTDDTPFYVEPEPEPVELDASQQNIVDDVNEYAFPITGASPNLDPAELSPLDRLGEVSIVGLGEATHGTKEFFQMKDRVFRYLVEEHGFKVFAFEMDFAESMIFNEYVLTGEGNLEKLMRDHMLFWTWRTTEVRDLLEWMKNYNLSRADEAKIQFWGYDTQFNTYNAPFLLDRLKKVDSSLYHQSKLLLSAFQNLDPDYYEGKSDEFRVGIKKDVDDTYNLIKENETLIVEKTSLQEFKLILQLARNIVQVEGTVHAYSVDNAPNLRDQYMAENQLWLLDYLGPGTKLASWAHNAHVAFNVNFGIGGAMGYHLRNELGKQYQIVGFSFAKGAFTAYNNVRLGPNVINQDPFINSINFYFYHSENDNFILDMSTLPGGSALNHLVSSQAKFLHLGAVYSGNPNNYYATFRLNLYFDFIIHFDVTQNSDLL